jgi:hypothetical protein
MDISLDKIPEGEDFALPEAATEARAAESTTPPPAKAEAAPAVSAAPVESAPVAASAETESEEAESAASQEVKPATIPVPTYVIPHEDVRALQASQAKHTLRVKLDSLCIKYAEVRVLRKAHDALAKQHELLCAENSKLVTQINDLQLALKRR